MTPPDVPRAVCEPEEELRLSGELAGLLAPAASEAEISARGLLVLVSTLRARGGAVLLRSAPGMELVLVSRCGELPCEPGPLIRLCSVQSGPGDEPGSIGIVSVLLPVGSDSDGLLVLNRPAAWDQRARFLALSGARAIAAALRSARLLQESRRQGVLLARRSLELDLLRELAETLSSLEGEERILQASIDLVLERLDLRAGWIFLLDSSGRRLALAGCRGVGRERFGQGRHAGPGACLCLDVFATGRSAVARNTLDCPRLPDLVGGDRPTSHACVPLKFERGVLGVMNIANRPGAVFNQKELSYLESVGRQICLAVDRDRTSRAETRRNEEALALASLARAVGASLDLEKILPALGEHVRDLFGADTCLIFLGDRSAAPTLAHRTGRPVEGFGIGASFEPAQVHEAPVILPAGPWGPGPALLVPLRARDRRNGLLVALRFDGPDWTAQELEMAVALAGQTAAAIENARLHREAQEALSRLQQAQYGMMNAERLSALGTLAACLAHEVRNPLNSISLQLVLLSRRASRLEPAAQGELTALIDTARREITRLDGLVEEFLSLSSIDQLRPVPADPEALVREVVALMTPLARDAGVSIVDAIETPLPQMGIDREKIKQVLINLIRNAIEAMPSGGTLTVSSRPVDNGLQVSVSDTGAGIQPDLDVFDFFVTTKRGGTGLGLPIARRIVEAHGGTLTFVSEPGRGATFSARLGPELRTNEETNTR